MTESLLNKVAEVKHIEAENALDKFRKVTGLVQATEEMMNDENADWYVPAGAFIPSDAEMVEAHIGEEVVEGVNDQYDVDKDGDIDKDDVEAAKNSEITVNPVEPEEDEKTESDAWTYVHDSTSYNAALADGEGLDKYYTTFPDEDLEGSGANATFNDRIYVGSLDNSNEVVEFKASWSEASQKITNVADETEVYYMERVDDEGNQYAKFQGESWTLYTDEALTTEAGHVFNIMRLEFDGFTHTYNAAVNAPGSTLPWVVVNFSGEETHTVEFEYDGDAIPAQWDHAINWGIVSVANDLGIADFDEAKLKMYITD